MDTLHAKLHPCIYEPICEQLDSRIETSSIAKSPVKLLPMTPSIMTRYVWDIAVTFTSACHQRFPQFLDTDQSGPDSMFCTEVYTFNVPANHTILLSRLLHKTLA